MRRSATMLVAAFLPALCVAPTVAHAGSGATSATDALVEFFHRTKGPWFKIGAAAAQQWLCESDFLGAIELDDNRHPVSLRTTAQLIDRAQRAARSTGAIHALDGPVRCHVEDDLGTCSATFSGTITQGDHERRFPLAGTFTAVRSAEGWRYLGWHVSRLHILDQAIFSAGEGWDLDDLEWTTDPTAPGAQHARIWTHPKSHAYAEFIEVDPGHRWVWSPTPGALHITGVSGGTQCRGTDGRSHRITNRDFLYLHAGERVDCESKDGARMFLVHEGPSRR